MNNGEIVEFKDIVGTRTIRYVGNTPVTIAIDGRPVGTDDRGNYRFQDELDELERREWDPDYE